MKSERVKMTKRLDVRRSRAAHLAGLLFSACWLAWSVGGAGIARADAGAEALARGHHATALRIWSPAAEAGDALAQNNLGYMHEHGKGVPQNYAEAMVWYRRAAEQKLPQAQHNVGLLYHEGYGVSVNHSEALRWFHQAAEQRLPESEYMIGLSHHQGKGVRADPAKALQWYLRSASNGYSAGQYMSSYLLLNGEAGPTKPLPAYVWATMALEQGYREAGSIVDLAALNLDPKQMERAKALAKRCRESLYKACAE